MLSIRTCWAPEKSAGGNKLESIKDISSLCSQAVAWNGGGIAIVVTKAKPVWAGATLLPQSYGTCS